MTVSSAYIDLFSPGESLGGFPDTAATATNVNYNIHAFIELAISTYNNRVMFIAIMTLCLSFIHYPLYMVVYID